MKSYENETMGEKKIRLEREYKEKVAKSLNKRIEDLTEDEIENYKKEEGEKLTNAVVERVRKKIEASEKYDKEFRENVSSHYNKPYDDLTEKEISEYRSKLWRDEWNKEMNETAAVFSTCWLCGNLIQANRTVREMRALYHFKVKCSRCKVGSATFIDSISRKFKRY